MSSNEYNRQQAEQTRILEYNQCIGRLVESIPKLLSHFDEQLPSLEYYDIVLDGESTISLEVGYYNPNIHTGMHGYLLPSGRLVEITHTVGVKYVKNKSTNYKVETHIVSDEYSFPKIIKLRYISKAPSPSILGLVNDISNKVDQELLTIEKSTKTLGQSSQESTAQTSLDAGGSQSGFSNVSSFISGILYGLMWVVKYVIHEFIAVVGLSIVFVIVTLILQFMRLVQPGESTLLNLVIGSTIITVLATFSIGFKKGYNSN